jgi:CBS domain-containing protein
MKVRELMSNPVVRIHADEPITVAARTLTRYNIGAMPVCGSDGRICGVITDRDIVTRCLAAQRPAEYTTVREVMTGQVLAVSPDMPVEEAAALMAKCQVRRLPVVNNGMLCGMITLGDLAASKKESFSSKELANVLQQITSNISMR